MLIVGVLALAASLVLLVFLLGENGFAKPETEEVAVAVPAPSGLARPHEPEEMMPLFKRFAGFAGRLTPANYGRSLQHKLDLAGNPRDWTAERVLAFKGIGVVIGVVLGIAIGSKHGIGILFFPLGLGAFGFFVADIWVRNLGERRQLQIRDGLADAIDMMTVCVEAGLGFDAALSRVARNLEGAVASEFARVLQEMQFGKARAEALRAMVDRTDVPELRTFVSSLVQSGELGISVGDVLREQAREMRVKRRQRAEEKAQKLPVKILFPLLACLLPCLFIVVLGPAIIGVAHTFGNLNK